MRNQTPEESAIEKKIREAADGAPLITFGYIGNFERWGDDRLLFLWISNKRWENGNLDNIWNCPAIALTGQAQACAMMALRHFKAGYEAAKREFETNQHTA